jgi:hypothetical protein
MKFAVGVLAVGFGTLALALILSWAGHADDVMMLWFVGMLGVLGGAAALSVAEWQAERTGTAPKHWSDPPIKKIEADGSQVEMPVSDYRAYLRSDAWKERRSRAVERAGGRCAVCNARGPLEVHHRRYDRVGRELPEDLLVLCRDCHDVFHTHRRLVR